MFLSSYSKPGSKLFTYLSDLSFLSAPSFLPSFLLFLPSFLPLSTSEALIMGCKIQEKKYYCILRESRQHCKKFFAR